MVFPNGGLIEPDSAVAIHGSECVLHWSAKHMFWATTTTGMLEMNGFAHRRKQSRRWAYGMVWVVNGSSTVDYLLVHAGLLIDRWSVSGWQRLIVVKYGALWFIIVHAGCKFHVFARTNITTSLFLLPFLYVDQHVRWGLEEATGISVQTLCKSAHVHCILVFVRFVVKIDMGFTN